MHACIGKERASERHCQSRDAKNVTGRFKQTIDDGPKQKARVHSLSLSLDKALLHDPGSWWPEHWERRIFLLFIFILQRTKTTVNEEHQPGSPQRNNPAVTSFTFVKQRILSENSKIPISSNGQCGSKGKAQKAMEQAKTSWRRPKSVSRTRELKVPSMRQS